MRTWKKAVSVLLSLAMLLALCVVGASAEGESEVSVATQDELRTALTNNQVTEITLTADIPMTGIWEPVVIDSERTLTINGDDYTISDMVVNSGSLSPSGTGVAGDGGSCDYYAGFISDNKGTLTINSLNFSNASVDIDPVTSGKHSTGSSILAVVCGNNTGTLEYNDVNVDHSTVKGYNKIGLLHGFTQGTGSFMANHCAITNSEVVCEADGSDSEAGYASIIIGYDGNNLAKTNGIKMENNTMSIADNVNWTNGGIQRAEDGTTYAVSTNGSTYGVTSPTYTHGSAGTTSVQFVAEINGYQYETLADAIAAAQNGQAVKLDKDIDLGSQLSISKSLTLNLNGHKIFNSADIWNDAEDTKAWSLVSVQAGGALTITGNGTLAAKSGDCYAVDLRDGASCIIENGTFIGNISAVYVEEGSLTVNNGSFSIQQLSEPGNGGDERFTLNCFDANYKDGTAQIAVNGGTFKKYNPADCLAEGPGTDFVSSAYSVSTSKNGDDTFYTVYRPSSGGGSSSASVVTTPTVSAPATSGSTTTVVETVKPTTSGTTASAAVTEKVIDEAAASAAAAAKTSGTAPVVEIKVDAASTAAEVQTTLPTAALKTVAEDGEELDINTPVADIALPATVVERISETAGTGNVTLSVEKVALSDLTAAQQAAIGETKDAVILDLNLTAGSTKISDLGGEVEISIPYTPAKNENMAGKTVWFIADDGTIIPCEGSYDAASETFTFKTTHFSTYVLASFPFTDVPTDYWAYSQIAWAYDNGYMNGKTDTSFAPMGTVNRQQLWMVLARMSGAAPADMAAAKDWAVANGISDGTEPEGSVSRQQMVTILYRYAQKFCSVAAIDGGAMGLAGFTDSGSIADYAHDAMLWACQSGIVQGSGSKLNPYAATTRAQFAVILDRFSAKVAK